METILKLLFLQHEYLITPWKLFEINTLNAIEIALGTIGLTWILTRSKLFFMFRSMVTLDNLEDPNKINWFLKSIFNCHGCMGFWSALFNITLAVYHLNVLILCFGGSYISLVAINHIMLQEKR